MASGKKTYMEYCTACHGDDGKGMGPAASALKTPPSDLTTLAKRHAGKFPEDYATEIVRFGKSIQSTDFVGHARLGYLSSTFVTNLMKWL